MVDCATNDETLARGGGVCSSPSCNDGRQRSAEGARVDGKLIVGRGARVVVDGADERGDGEDRDGAGSSPALGPSRAASVKAERDAAVHSLLLNDGLDNDCDGIADSDESAACTALLDSGGLDNDCDGIAERGDSTCGSSGDGVVRNSSSLTHVQRALLERGIRRRAGRADEETGGDSEEDLAALARFAQLEGLCRAHLQEHRRGPLWRVSAAFRGVYNITSAIRVPNQD